MRNGLAFSVLSILFFLAGCATDSHIADTNDPNRYSYFALPIPNKDWAILVNYPGFQIDKSGQRTDGKGIAIRANHESGIILTIYADKTYMDGDSKTCRDFYLPRIQQSPMVKMFLKDKIETSEYKDKSILDYTLRGGLTKEKHMNAYLVKDSYWIDIHLSKKYYTSIDMNEFYSILDSIKIIEKGLNPVQ